MLLLCGCLLQRDDVDHLEQAIAVQGHLNAISKNYSFTKITLFEVPRDRFGERQLGAHISLDGAEGPLDVYQWREGAQKDSYRSLS